MAEGTKLAIGSGEHEFMSLDFCPGRFWAGAPRSPAESGAVPPNWSVHVQVRGA